MSLKYIDFNTLLWKYFLPLILITSNLKNLFSWKYYEVHNKDLFHYPVFVNIGSELISISILIIVLILSIYLLINKKIYSLTLITSGLQNLYFSSQDLLIIHHDVIFSGLIFVMLGVYKLKIIKYIHIEPLYLGIYFTTGLNKINSHFFEGNSTKMILDRVINTDTLPSSLFQIAAIGAFTIEIIAPLVIIFKDQLVKTKVLDYLMVILLIYHSAILLTGTAAVFNTLFPFLFLISYSKNNKIIYILCLCIISYLLFWILKVNLLNQIINYVV